MSYDKGMTLEFSSRASSPVQPPNGVTKAKGAGKDAGKKTKTPKVDKNDLSWSLSNVNDTIDKSHKFLVMHRHSAAQPEESIYEPKRQATVEKSHLEASPCVLDIDVPKRTLSLSSTVPGERGRLFPFSKRKRLRPKSTCGI